MSTHVFDLGTFSALDHLIYSLLRARSDLMDDFPSGANEGLPCQVLSVLLSSSFQLWLRACCILWVTALLFMSSSQHCQKEYDERK